MIDWVFDSLSDQSLSDGTSLRGYRSSGKVHFVGRLFFSEPAHLGRRCVWRFGQVANPDKPSFSNPSKLQVEGKVQAPYSVKVVGKAGFCLYSMLYAFHLYPMIRGK